MQGTIKGVYKNGQVILEETPNIDGLAEVLVTFTGSIVPQPITSPLDVAARLQELSLLEDGWLNGEGLAPKKQDLQWFATNFENFYHPTLPLPFLYPTITGGVQAEWAGDGYDVSLTVELPAKKAFYQYLDHTNNRVEEMALDLAKGVDWQLLNTKLQTILNALNA
jgi:hypothetical protein